MVAGESSFHKGRRDGNQHAGSRRLVSPARVRAFFRDIADLWSPDDEFVRRQAEYFRHFSAAGMIAYPMTGAFLWLWDLSVDPIGARETLLLRALYLVFAVNISVLPLKASVGLRAAATIVAILLGEALYLVILSRLENGYEAGVGGFMFFNPIGAMLMFGLTLRAATVFTVAVTIAPLVPAFVGILPDYPLARHSALLIPAAGDGLLICGVMGWLSLRRFRVENALERASRSDFLTGLANRRGFADVLEAEFRRGRRDGRTIALALFDIDHFKRINDSFGHATGDEVLRAVAEVFRSQCREGELPARVGGDEFAVVGPNSEEEDVRALTERVRAAIAGTRMRAPDGREFGISVSCGLEIIRGGTAGTPDDLFAAADRDLYDAKHARAGG